MRMGEHLKDPSSFLLITIVGPFHTHHSEQIRDVIRQRSEQGG